VAQWASESLPDALDECNDCPYRASEEDQLRGSHITKDMYHRGFQVNKFAEVK
jgi:hypothetical protein